MTENERVRKGLHPVYCKSQSKHTFDYCVAVKPREFPKRSHTWHIEKFNNSKEKSKEEKKAIDNSEKEGIDQIKKYFSQIDYN